MVGFRSSRLAVPALLLMAALWGSTLVVMKGIYAHMSPENL
ncbi:EamA/RhaT family transporter, partial [Xanthomonas citri pv. citri]|nr:EamA/RhaT family transporter [Xanthomonas citri pv. citri]